MKLRSACIASIPNDEVWTSVIHQPVDAGYFFVGVYCAGEQAHETGVRLRESIQTFLQSPFDPQLFVSFFQSLDIAESTLCAGILTKQESIFFAAGTGRIDLLREGSPHTIIQSQEGAASQFMRGEIIANDVICAGNEGFFSRFFDAVQTALDPIEKVSLLSSDTATLANISNVVGIVLEREESVVVTPSQKVNLPPPSTALTNANVTLVGSRHFASTSFFTPRKVQIIRKIGMVFLIILICIGGILAGQQFLLNRRNNRITSVLTPYQKRFESASDSGKEKIGKIQELRSLLTDLEELEKQYEKDRLLSKEIDKLIGSVRSTYTQTSGQKDIAKLSVFYDFRLVASDFIGSAVAYDVPGKLAVFLDSNKSRLLSLSLENKSPQTLTVDEKLANPRSVAVENRKAYVLGNAGVLELSLPLDQMGKMVVNADSEWKEPKLVGAFGTNVYVFDSERRAITRFDTTDSSASGSAWLRNKEGLEFSEVNSLTVDGEMWLTTVNGKIFRYIRGEKVGFTLHDAVGLPNSTLLLYTTKDSQYVYLLEPRQKRLLVYTKTGEYVSSVQSEDLATATSLIVDEESKTAYILAGSLLYSVKIE